MSPSQSVARPTGDTPMIAHTQVQNYLLLVYHTLCYTGTVHTKQPRNVENKPKPRRVANHENPAKKSKKPQNTGRVASKNVNVTEM